MKQTITAIILATAMLATTAFAAGDIAAGKDKSYTCVGCHGTPNMDNAYPNYRAPKIGGQSAVYIVSALKSYADGSRWHPTMRAQAMALSDKDIADIAAYLESLRK